MLLEHAKCAPASSLSLNVCSRDFPGGPEVKNPPCNAGDMGLIPGEGTKMPQARKQLSLRATTRVCAPQQNMHGLFEDHTDLETVVPVSSSAFDITE